MTRRPPWWYRALQVAGYAFYRVAFRLQVEGREHVPRQGGFIVSLNHVSAFDPPLVGILVPVQMRFLAKQELFRFGPLAYLLKALGAIPVRRGEADRAALRASLDALRQGYGLSVFPEGTRHQRARGQARGGAAYLSLKAGVPVLPGAILGKYRLFGPLVVRFGPPIYGHEELAKRGVTSQGSLAVRQLSGLIMQRIQDLGRGSEGYETPSMPSRSQTPPQARRRAT
jgi:1-acyl-sn-glycerol-3-phosphate acyltransferase